MLVNNFANIIKAKNHLSRSIHWIHNKPRHMALEIQVLAWDMDKMWQVFLVNRIQSQYAWYTSTYINSMLSPLTLDSYIPASGEVLWSRKLPTLPEHLSSPPVFSGVRVTRSLVLCVCFVDGCLSFLSFFIVVSVLLRYTDSDYLPLVSSNSSWYYMYLLLNMTGTCASSWSFTMNNPHNSKISHVLWNWNSNNANYKHVMGQYIYRYSLVIYSSIVIVQNHLVNISAI